MRNLFRIASMLATACAVCAQQPNTVTVNVSTTQPVAAGTASFAIQFAETNLASTVDSALGVMGNAGVTASNLTGISVSISQGFIVTQYDFTLAVPASQFSAARDKLIAVQRNLVNSNTQFIGWTTSYAASDEDTANALQQALPGLLAQAKLQAGALAAAISLNLGAVQSVTAPTISKNTLTLGIGLTVTYVVQ